MRQRWLRVAALGGLLFAINAAARLFVWRTHIAGVTQQTRIGLIAFVAIGLVFAVAAGWWAVRYPLIRVVPDLLVAGLVGCLLSVLVGPFFSGSKPVAEGISFLFVQILQYLVLGALGATLGVLVVIAVGRDWKTRVWKQREATLRANRSRSKRHRR
jgi:hypothetical protein